MQPPLTSDELIIMYIFFIQIIYEKEKTKFIEFQSGFYLMLSFTSHGIESGKMLIDWLTETWALKLNEIKR